MAKYDTFLRQWTMLRMIPRYPCHINTRTLLERLRAEGFRVDIRSIQRDLEALSLLFPLDRDENSKPHGWRWAMEAGSFDLPGMEPSAALAFKVAEGFLSSRMPREVMDALQPHFRLAAGVLESASAGAFRCWTDKVRVISGAAPLMPLKLDGEVRSTVYKALFEEVRFHAHYLPRGQDNPDEYVVNPLGLVFRKGVVYLVATLWDYDNVIQLALHRFRKVALLEEKATVPDDFDLDAYIGQGEFSYPLSPKPMGLRLRFAGRAAARSLEETPLSGDQILKPRADGSVDVRATVMDSLELRWWLLGFGDSVEVLGPARLRRAFQQMVRRLQAMYFPAGD